MLPGYQARYQLVTRLPGMLGARLYCALHFCVFTRIHQVLVTLLLGRNSHKAEPIGVVYCRAVVLGGKGSRVVGWESCGKSS